MQTPHKHEGTAVGMGMGLGMGMDSDDDDVWLRRSVPSKQAYLDLLTPQKPDGKSSNGVEGQKEMEMAMVMAMAHDDSSPSKDDMLSSESLRRSIAERKHNVDELWVMSPVSKEDPNDGMWWKRLCMAMVMVMVKRCCLLFSVEK